MTPEEILEKIHTLETLIEKLKSAEPGTTPVDSIAQLKILIRSFFTKILTENASGDQRFLSRVLNLLIMFNSKYNFDKLLNTQVKYALLIPYLQAFVSKDSNPQLAIESLEMIEKALESHLGLKTPQFFTTESKAVGGKKQFFTKEGFRKIRLAVLYIETILQSTAMLSKLQMNAEALKKAHKGFEASRILIKSLQIVVDQIIQVGMENLKVANSFEVPLEWVYSYLEFLGELSMERLSAGETSWTDDTLSWKANKENTLKYLVQRIEGKRKGSKSVGKKVAREWVRNFSICNVVKLDEFEVFEKRLDSSELDDNLIMRLILIVSCNIFSIAAENRFLSTQEFEANSKKHIENQAAPKFLNRDGPRQPSALDTVVKDSTLQKDPRYITSERIHLKSIEVILFGFDDNLKLIDHLLHSYRKNYYMTFYVIAEEEETSLNTSRVSEYFEQGQTPGWQEEEIASIRQINQKLTLLVPGSSATKRAAQKDSIDLFVKKDGSAKKRPASKTEKIKPNSSDNGISVSEKISSSVDKILFNKILKNIKSLKDKSANGKALSTEKSSGMFSQNSLIKAESKRKMNEPETDKKKKDIKSMFSSKFADVINQMSSDIKMSNKLEGFEGKEIKTKLPPNLAFDMNLGNFKKNKV